MIYFDVGLVYGADTSDPQWINSVITVVAVFIAFILGLLGDYIRTKLNQPKLILSTTNKPPDSHKINITKGSDFVAECYYFRMRVENKGNSTAQDVEVYLKELEMCESGRYREYDIFSPLMLLWSHYPEGKYYTPSIPSGSMKHVTLGRIVEPNNRSKTHEDFHPRLNKIEAIKDINIFRFSFIVYPNTGSYLIEPGKYRVLAIVSATNMKSKKYYIHLEFKDNWIGDEIEMLSKGIDIKIKKVKRSDSRKKTCV